MCIENKIIFSCSTFCVSQTQLYSHVELIMYRKQNYSRVKIIAIIVYRKQIKIIAIIVNCKQKIEKNNMQN